MKKIFLDDAVDVERAKEEILPKTVAMLPALENAKITGCYAGLRVVTPNHMPFAEKVGERLWAITGMGSKGLLYHALKGKMLALDILNKLFDF